jgi:hypothetical protein
MNMEISEDVKQKIHDMMMEIVNLHCKECEDFYEEIYGPTASGNCPCISMIEFVGTESIDFPDSGDDLMFDAWEGIRKNILESSCVKK